MYKQVLILTLFLSTWVGYGQKNDSLVEKVQAVFADKFPSTRVLNAEYRYLGDYKNTSKNKEGVLSHYKLTNVNQYKFDANFDLYKRPQWLLSGSLKYQHFSFDLTPKDTSLEKMSNNVFQYQSTSLNLTRITRLFNKTAVFNTTVTLDGSQKHFERVKGSLAGTLVLKYSEKTTLIVGLLAIVEANPMVPLIPLFSYEGRFKNRWEIDVTLPQRALVKKQVGQHTRISVGSELQQTSFYIYDQGTYELKQLEINNGINYERIIANQFIFFMKTGMQTIASSRVLKKNASFKNYTLDNKAKDNFYFNVGLSFNPFYKKKN